MASMELIDSATGQLRTATTSDFAGGGGGTATNLRGGNNTTQLGSIPYQSAVDTTLLLAPNTSTTKRFLTQTGNGTNGAAPSWGSVVAADVSVGATFTPTDSVIATNDTTLVALQKAQGQINAIRSAPLRVNCSWYIAPTGSLTTTVDDAGYTTERFHFTRQSVNDTQGLITLNANGVFTINTAGTYRVKNCVFLKYAPATSYTATARNITSGTAIASAPHSTSSQSFDGIREVSMEFVATFAAGDRFAIEQTGGWSSEGYNYLVTMTADATVKDAFARKTMFIEFVRLA